MKFHSKFLVTSAKLSQHHSVKFRGLGIVIEWPKGSVRVGEDKNGKKWHRKMEADYGYIPDTTAAGDGEGLDVYIGPDEHSDKVYVVEQLKEDGEFDEYKVLLGFPDLETAYETYLKHYPDDWDETRVGDVSEVPFDYAFDTIEEHQEENKTASEATLPRYLYHGSPRTHMEDNLQNGLRKKHSTSHNEWEGGAVYLATDPGAAAMYPDHWEAGEDSSKGNVVYRVDTKYLNQSLLRPDDADFPDMFANMDDEETAELEARFGDDFSPDSWAHCEWPVSLYLTGQVAYMGDIPSEALALTDINRGKRAAGQPYLLGMGPEAMPGSMLPTTEPKPRRRSPVPTKPTDYVWLYDHSNREFHIAKGEYSSHWSHFVKTNIVSSDDFSENCTRGYAHLDPASKTVFLGLTDAGAEDCRYFPEAAMKELQKRFPKYQLEQRGIGRDWNRRFSATAPALDPAIERMFNPQHGMAKPAVEGYIWISPGRNEDYILKGGYSDHWKFQERGYMAGRPLNEEQYDNSPRGYAEVKNDSKTVILSTSTAINPSYDFIPESVVKEFQQKFPSYKIYKNAAKTAGIAYLNALKALRH